MKPPVYVVSGDQTKLYDLTIGANAHGHTPIANAGGDDHLGTGGIFLIIAVIHIVDQMVIMLAGKSCPLWV